MPNGDPASSMLSDYGAVPGGQCNQSAMRTVLRAEIQPSKITKGQIMAVKLLGAALLGSCLLAGASLAEPAATPVSGPAAAATAATPGHVEKRSPAALEQRIHELHSKLKITGAQEAQWTEVAQIMRENNDNLNAAIEQRDRETDQTTAIDDLNSYKAFHQAHVDGLNRLIPAFQTLYTAMSDEQKKNADSIFGESRHPKKG